MAGAPGAPTFISFEKWLTREKKNILKRKWKTKFDVTPRVKKRRTPLRRKRRSGEDGYRTRDSRDPIDSVENLAAKLAKAPHKHTGNLPAPVSITRALMDGMFAVAL